MRSRTPRSSRPGRTPIHVAALLRERRRRLAALRRYDRYIAEAAGDLTLQAFWRNLRRQEQEDAHRLAARLDREAARCGVGGGLSITRRRSTAAEEESHAGSH